MGNIKVFYMDEQTAKKNDSFSPSACKPAEVIKSWKEKFHLEIKDFQPITREGLCLAHSPRYVRGILDLQIQNGFGNTLPEVRDSLLYTVGSMVAAAFHAAQTGETAISPTSGFHHSCYDNGGGFCTFNGLIVAARMLKLYGAAKKVGILDCDAHYGNGTANIIEKKKLKFITHYTFGGDNVTKENAEQWLKRLPEIVCSMRDCDVILFQAGADPHENDPLGGVLSSDQMRRRDRIVFETAKRLGIPVAWNLAGGYQEPLRKVLDIHDTTLEECIKVNEKEVREVA